MVKERLKFSVMFCCILALILPSSGYAVNFSINPIRVFFDGKSKTNILTIKNESNHKVTLQLKAARWDQDEAGESIYSPSDEIIFFPKMLELEPNREKIVRIGTRVPREDKEKTYRLFLEEMPRPAASENTAVQLIMKVGVPVFITPLKTKAKGEIMKTWLSGGKLNITVTNEGNVHFIVRAIRLKGANSSGEEVYSSETGGRYIHQGKTRSYTINIPKGKCRETKKLHIDIDTDRFSLGKEINVSREMCGP